jgi:hypothetical protein
MSALTTVDRETTIACFGGGAGGAGGPIVGGTGGWWHWSSWYKKTGRW